MLQDEPCVETFMYLSLRKTSLRLRDSQKSVRISLKKRNDIRDIYKMIFPDEMIQNFYQFYLCKQYRYLNIFYIYYLLIDGRWDLFGMGANENSLIIKKYIYHLVYHISIIIDSYL